jgi:cephalosporin hydroxylase
MYKEAVDESYVALSGRVGQNKDELYSCAQFVEKLKPVNILEIGSQFGGTFYVWCRLSSGIRISVDLPEGSFGGINQEATDKRNAKIKSVFSDVHFIAGDSHEPSTRSRVENILRGDRVDFLFIDADHTYEGVKKDYDMYRSFVSSGGYIGFHDINKIEECQVDRLWEELVGEKVEVNYKQSWVSWRTNLGGIGLIKNED